MIFKTLAEAIVDFSNHNISKMDLYEIVSKLILDCTDEDKQDYVNGISAVGVFPSTKYVVAKKWLDKGKKLSGSVYVRKMD